MLQFKPIITSGDFLSVGHTRLFLNWNEICDDVRKQEFYAMDGEGSFTVYRNQDYGNGHVSAIVNYIFVHYETLDEFDVVMS